MNDPEVRRRVDASLRVDQTGTAHQAAKNLETHYRFLPEGEAGSCICLGGDGFMLQNLRDAIGGSLSMYGMNCGSYGFLSNEFALENLPERLNQARLRRLQVLRMRAELVNGEVREAQAINEVSIFRATRQALKLSVWVDGVSRLLELTCDGLLVATPAGSTAYNRSAGGPIIPIGAGVLALTAISPFRPRWRGAILPVESKVRVDLLEANKRPGHAVADIVEVENVVSVEISLDTSLCVGILFDVSHDLEERIIKEQFTT